jgi:hypothetical protein
MVGFSCIFNVNTAGLLYGAVNALRRDNVAASEVQMKPSPELKPCVRYWPALAYCSTCWLTSSRKTAQKYPQRGPACGDTAQPEFRHDLLAELRPIRMRR